jgi:hypothetical protein
MTELNLRWKAPAANPVEAAPATSVAGPSAGGAPTPQLGAVPVQRDINLSVLIDIRSLLGEIKAMVTFFFWLAIIGLAVGVISLATAH